MRRDFLGLLKSQNGNTLAYGPRQPVQAWQAEKTAFALQLSQIFAGLHPNVLGKVATKFSATKFSGASSQRLADHRPRSVLQQGITPPGRTPCRNRLIPRGAETTTGLLTCTLQKQGTLSREVEGPSTPVVSLTVLISEQLCHFAFVVTLPLLPCL